MPRPRHMDNLPVHPTIDLTDIRTMKLYGHTGPAAKITCPYCNREKWYPLGILRQIVKRQNFKGICHTCWRKLPKERTYRSGLNPSGRSVLKNGYVRLGKNAFTDDELDWYDAMRNRSGSLYEHRWIMAKHIGRPLTRYELVDHKDGIHSNNDLDNLRLYIKGKNQPGSANGYGTYYHEWQIAEKKIQDLEKEIEHLKLFMDKSC